MATVSSHILDSVSGISAMGIRSELYRIGPDHQRVRLFDIVADGEGRISQSVDVASDEEGHEYELVFHGADYFARQPIPAEDNAMVKTVVIRFAMVDNDKRYHIPVMLSPHSYSVWWSR